MSSTRLAIRQSAAQRLGGLTLGSATSSATAPVASITDTATLLDSGDSTYTFIGEYLCWDTGLNAGAERRIASYVPSTGIVGCGANFTSNIVQGDTYEINAHLSAAEWNRCISGALRRVTRRREEAITIVDDQNQYVLSSLTDLNRNRQVLDVFTQRGPSGQKTRLVLHPKTGYEFWEDDDVLTLSLANSIKANAADNLTLNIAYLAPYADLTTDASTTTCDFDLIVTGTLLQAMEWFPQRLEEPAKKTLMMGISDLKRTFLDQVAKVAPDRAKMIGVRFS